MRSIIFRLRSSRWFATLLLLAFFAFLFAIPSSSQAQFCTADYSPVCGVDEVTYSNSCWANHYDVEIAYHGECVSYNGSDEYQVYFELSPEGEAALYELEEALTHVEDDIEEAYDKGLDPSFAEEIFDALLDFMDANEPQDEAEFWSILDEVYVYVDDIFDELDKVFGGIDPDYDYDEPVGLEPVICPEDYSPVCSTNGVTFENTCWMERANSEFAYWGECEDEDHETEFEHTPEMEEALEELDATMISLIEEIEQAEEDGFDVSAVEELFKELIAYTEENETPSDAESFWNAMEDMHSFINEVYKELDHIYADQGGEPGGIIDFGEVSDMREALYEVDENMRKLILMLEWLEGLGADLSELEDTFRKVADLFQTAESYLENENTNDFWAALEDLDDYVDDVFLPEMERVVLNSDAGQFLEQIGSELDAIDEEVEFLEENDMPVPNIYSEIQFLNESIGEAFENEDFSKVSDMIDRLVILIDQFWSALGEDDFEISFEPPAGYEDEVITFYSDNPFPDTSDGSIEGKAAADLYRRAVIGGFPDGEFKGDRPVNRAEAAKFLLLAAGIDVMDIMNRGKFADVVDDQWYTPFVMTAADKDIISGHPDGSFRPADTVNTAEFLKMLNLTFGVPINLPFSYVDVPSSAWFASYAGIAETYDLFPDRDTHLLPAQELTRAEVAVAIYQYLKNEFTIQFN